MFKSGLYIWYNVSDIKVTKQFYTEKLGFSIIMDDVEAGMFIVEPPTKNTEIGFSYSQEVVPSTASVVFEVDDIVDSVKSLTDKGIVFIGEVETLYGLAKLATFQDPDGNSLMLCEALNGQ